MKARTVALLAPLLALLATRAPADENKEEGNFLSRAIANVALGPGQRVAQITIFPLISLVPPAEPEVVADRRAAGLAYEEPEFPARRYDLFAGNGEKKPALLFGGTVLVGGTIDRMVPNDILLPPGGEVEFHALAAAPSKEKRDKPVAFEILHSVAPVYLRERAVLDPSAWLIRNFVGHYEEFINPDDERRSLAAVDESEILGKYCLICQTSMNEFTHLSGGRVVGFVTAVRGRVHDIELFGSNALLDTYFEPILRAHAWTAAAIAIRAEKAGIPIPEEESDAATVAKVKEDVDKILDRLRRASYRSAEQPKGAAGESLLLRTSREHGFGVGLDGNLVHASIFPHDPFETALYSTDLEIPEGDVEASGGPGLPELERGAMPGRRLTEYEQRLLERMRRNRNRGGLPFGR